MSWRNDARLFLDGLRTAIVVTPLFAVALALLLGLSALVASWVFHFVEKFLPR